ncbi:hypothetical protein QYF61_022242 [Mycteria americana]|uniref:Uncharacterized protein n=1 Tax=Mycteria americana TaxID=33587 RepID=A0AAN7PKF1_MYCAM|nr:hypothetical protein QYF61_022242 [Mycteria americana]
MLGPDGIRLSQWGKQVFGHKLVGLIRRALNSNQWGKGIPTGLQKGESRGILPHAFFASVFNNTDRPCAARSPESEDHNCGNSDVPFVVTELDELYQLNVHKSMEREGMYPRVLKELADGMAEPLLITYQRCWESADWGADSLGTGEQIPWGLGRSLLTGS